MKVLTLVALLTICYTPIFGQCDNSLVGKWKVISVFNGEIYFNLKTDSTFLTEEAKQKYPDTLAQKQFIQNAKFIYGTTTFEFQRNGVLILDMTSIFQDTSRYCYNSTDKILQHTAKNSYGQELTDTVAVTFRQNLLCFRFREIDAYYYAELERVE